MRFRNRAHAGRLLARKLDQYRGKNVYIYAVPRGGVVTGVEVANYLDAPLGLLLTRKIGYPHQPEYAIAAVSESGYLIGKQRELALVDRDWLAMELERQVEEIKRRRVLYRGGRAGPYATGGIAIIVDDGVATGLSLQAGIMEIKDMNPEKIVVAVPVIPKEVANELGQTGDEVVSIIHPPADKFLGSVGMYYADFAQVSDEEVISLLKKRESDQMKSDISHVLENVAQW